MRIRVAQIGARKAYAVPGVFARSGQLERLCTDLYYGGRLDSLFVKGLEVVGKSATAESFRGRCCSDISANLVKEFALPAILNKWAIRRASKTGGRYGAFLSGSSRFSRSVARMSWEGVDAVYAFSSAALEVFESARKHGVVCILDHETAPADLEADLFREVEKKYRAWVPSHVTNDEQSLDQYSARQRAEVDLADVVICPSTFSAQLIGDRPTVEILPFAMSEAFNCPTEIDFNNANTSRPLRILFAGNDEIRKGLPVLVEALRKLPQELFECKGAGNWNLSKLGWKSVSAVMEPLGAVPRGRMPDLYDWADVFVMPTFSDTMGVVILEAMARGVPVITTRNSGGPDLIQHGGDGYILDAGDSPAVAEILVELASDRDKLIDVSRSARKKSEHFDMTKYSERLLRLTQRFV